MSQQKMTIDPPRRFSSQRQLDGAIWQACNILRRSNCAGALQYVPELTWLLFLRILDEREELEQEQSDAVSHSFTPSLAAPYRWRDWAAPDGAKRIELQEGALGAYFEFVNAELLPYLRSLADQPSASPRQRVISQIMSGVERTKVDTERNFLDVLDQLHPLTIEAVDQTHVFALSQVFEGLLLRMGEKNNDGGQFFTPREIVRAMVQTVDPRPGETIYDPCCGTGGFLAQAFEHIQFTLPEHATASVLETLKLKTFYGREKDDVAYPVAVANLVLHGIDVPHIWHGNTLTGQETYGGLFQDVPSTFDVILTNPPFGGKEGREAQTNFAFKTSATQVLFLQHVIDSLSVGGRCSIVMDEGVLFRTNENAFVQTKRKLLDECHLDAIVSLPPGVFVSAGAGVKTNLLFFTKGEPTDAVWYYDLSDIKVGKKTPLTIDRFEEFYRLFPLRGESDRSWTVPREEIEASNYDLKAVNPHVKAVHDLRSPGELVSEIEVRNDEVTKALAELRALIANIN